MKPGTIRPSGWWSTGVPGSSVAVLTLQDGRWLMLYNDTELGRHQLLLALSEDEGETWAHKRYLDKAAPSSGSSYGYPTIIQAKNGTIHVSYTYKTMNDKGIQVKSIKHAAFDPDWVKE